MFPRSWAASRVLKVGGLILGSNKRNLSTAPAPSGGGFLARLNAFLVGCGVSFGASYYLIYEELRESNTRLSSEIEKIKKEALKK